MSKVKLEIDFEYDFLLFGICSHAKDYRLCGAINKRLGFDFEKQNDLVIAENKLEGFSLFAYENHEKHLKYWIAGNRGKTGLLVHEYKQADYFMVVEGVHEQIDKENLISKLKEIDVVLTIFELNPETLKSKQNLIFE